MRRGSLGVEKEGAGWCCPVRRAPVLSDSGYIRPPGCKDGGGCQEFLRGREGEGPEFPSPTNTAATGYVAMVTKGLTVLEPSARVMAFSIQGRPSTRSTMRQVIWFLRKLTCSLAATSRAMRSPIT